MSATNNEPVESASTDSGEAIQDLPPRVQSDEQIKGGSGDLIAEFNGTPRTIVSQFESISDISKSKSQTSMDAISNLKG